MKSFIFIIMMSICLTISNFASAQNKDAKKSEAKTAVVVFNSDIDCNNCKKRIEKNIAYEKGVKELEVNLEDKTVKVVYRKDKTNSEKLRAAIEKLGFKSFIKEEKDLK